jgi:hypothetical protein
MFIFHWFSVDTIIDFINFLCDGGMANFRAAKVNTSAGKMACPSQKSLSCPHSQLNWVVKYL